MPVTATPFDDGLGGRRQIVGARDQPLDVLILHDELAAVPAFEAAVRQRIEEFAAFHHPAFPRVRGIGRVTKGQSRLVVASDRADGVRLSQLLATAEKRLIPVEIDAAFCLLRQLVPAVAALHEQFPETAHGALAPERLVVTADGRLLVVEHVFAGALEEMRFSYERYWKELRVALPFSGGMPRFDRRADVTQIGATALALILGRPLGDDEYPARVADIVEAVRAISANGLELLPDNVRSWLCRALQLEPRHSYATAIEAQLDLERIAMDEARARESLAAFLAQYESVAGPIPRPAPAAAVEGTEADAAAARAGRNVRPGESDHASRPVNDRPTLDESRPVDRPPYAEGRPATAEPPPHESETDTASEEAPVASAAAPSGRGFSAGETDDDSETAPVVPHRSLFEVPSERASDEDPSAEDEAVPARARIGKRVAAAIAVVVALGTAGVFAGRSYMGEAAGTLVVNTRPSGAEVAIDGQPKGTTPLTIELPAGDHVLALTSGGETRTLPVTIGSGAQVAQFIELPEKVIAVTHGQLAIRTEPAGATITVDGDRRGVSPLLIDKLEPGVHVVRLENAMGSVTEQVTIAAGATASLVVPLAGPQGVPVSGWISVAAPIEMQIFENGRLLGSSRSERIMMSVGRHQLQLANDTVGYNSSHTVQVSPGRVTPLTIQLPRGSMSLNALPWAEVWVDGERVGETPLGNVPVAVGTHDVLFRHPELGEQRQAVTVTLAGPARVSADLRKR